MTISKPTEYETAWLRIRRYSLERIPHVTALTAIRTDGRGRLFIGATSHPSEQPVLMRLDPATGEVTDTGVRFPPKGRPGTQAYSVGDKIHAALGNGRGPWEGWFFIGHGSHLWWNEVGWVFPPDVFEGGHIYAWHPETCETRDLGLAVRLNTVHGLFAGEGVVVGYSLPDNHFFAFDIASGRCTDYGRISAYCCHSFGIWRDKAFGAYVRAHGEQRGELALAAEKSAFLLVYDHATRELQRTEVVISGLEPNIRHNSGIDSWVATDQCLLGGRVDGSIFRLDPDSREVREYGKPIPPMGVALPPERMRKLGGIACSGITGSERVTSMNRLPDGRILGTAGFPHMHVFTLDTTTGAFRDYGVVDDQHEMCYFHSSCVLRMSSDATSLAMIETDSLRPAVCLAEPLDGRW